MPPSKPFSSSLFPLLGIPFRLSLYKKRRRKKKAAALFRLFEQYADPLPSLLTFFTPPLRWSKHLWVFASYFWPRKGIKHDKLKAIYAKSLLPFLPYLLFLSPHNATDIDHFLFISQQQGRTLDSLGLERTEETTQRGRVGSRLQEVQAELVPPLSSLALSLSHRSSIASHLSIGS
jgi:hypothetical protein